MINLEKYIDDHLTVIGELKVTLKDKADVLESIAKRVVLGSTVFFAGNGGSAADCQHLAAELTGRYVKERKSLPGIALTVDTSAITAIGNDYAFDEIFARQLKGLGRTNDILIVISTSGNSSNLIRAAKAAKEKNIFVFGLLGRDGGNLLGYCDDSIIVPSCVTARIQEAHILIGHLLCEFIDEAC